MEAFRTRPLDAGPNRFVGADAVLLRVREDGRVVNVHALIAVGVNAEWSAEPAGNVVLGGLLVRVGENLLRVVDFDQPAGLAGGLEVKERGLIADPGGLLHVVGHDDDGVVLLELSDQILDRQRRDGVKRGTRFVHQQYVR